jgi:aminoglycoside phosphotransferase (APT) family kinase protein
MDKKLIDAALAHRLVSEQFPEWKNCPVRLVGLSGWDNRTFHLGDEMLIRMPSAADYALQVDKEHKWLPKLAPLLPIQIPTPLAIGKPAHGYPWNWSVYRWIIGTSAASEPITDLNAFAKDLAQFLIALQSIDSTNGPAPGLHSFYRGGSLKTYDLETRQALALLKGKIDVDAAKKIWETALFSSWQGAPVWVHGDISAGNLLLQNGRLSAVIDFGQLTIGDPACDLAIAWTLFHSKSREIFHSTLLLDHETWARAKAWTLWKALVVAAGFTNPDNKESAQCWRIIDDLLTS